VNYLLDTGTFLWIVLDPSQLSSQAILRIQDPANRLFLSAVSAWEVAVAHGLGRITLQVSPDQLVTSQRTLHGINPLALTEVEAVGVFSLPRIHKDPFDRMLICQAMSNGLILLTPDHLIRQYPGVQVEW
jgi:PIN domain nuclease of toxin-antitoxin system